MNFREELRKFMIEIDPNDPVILEFEKELAGRDFNNYCVDVGYFTERETELENGNLLTEFLFVPEKIKELALAWSKMKALKAGSIKI